MKLVKEIKSFLLQKINFESNEEIIGLDKGDQLQNILSVEFAGFENIASPDRYKITVSVNLKTNIDDGKDDPQDSLESNKENLFVFFIKYQMIFSIEENVDISYTGTKDDICDELIGVIQSYIRRDIQYISLDSNFDATSFPLQFINKQ